MTFFVGFFVMMFVMRLEVPFGSSFGCSLNWCSFVLFVAVSKREHELYRTVFAALKRCDAVSVSVLCVLLC